MNHQREDRVARLPILVLLAIGRILGVSLVGAAGCASTDQGHDARYPRRAAGCELAIYYTAVPGVPAWDDLGIVEIACHISDPAAECLRRLRNEACQMGGDIIYNVPRQPLRPRDQVLVYRGQVAHSRAGVPSIKADDADMPPPASAEESAGPVVPLPSEHVVAPTPAPPPSRSDSGVPDSAPPAKERQGQ